MKAVVFTGAAPRGFTLIEVLVTIVILAVGLLGLALMQATSLNNQLEAYQRAQAMLLLEDMSNRIRVNSDYAKDDGTGAPGYPDGNQYGLQDAQDCTLLATAADRDMCDWNTALIGSRVTLGVTNVGSLVGATGCIQNLPGSGNGDVVIRLTIAWQGMNKTAVPASACGKDAFGADEYRRVASIDTVLANL